MKKWMFLLGFVLPSVSYSVEPTKVFVELAKKVRASVVNISITKEEVNDMIQLFPGYFMPFNLPQMTGSGSGFIVDKKGLIVTNAHVVQNFDKIQVQFSGDDQFYSAKVLGTDTLSDIALLKVNTKKRLKPFAFGDSEKLEVGEWVAAIGNPHGYGHTMTKGIISAMKREIDDLNLFPLLQTDASINPGNSGGPLVNLKGEVVGVNQAIVRGAMGISFAIPINNVKEVLEDLKTFGFVRRGFIGVEFFSGGQNGAVVTNVIPGSPAQKAGLQVKDRIVIFDGKKIKAPKDLPQAVRKAKVGKKVSLKIVRNGKQINLKVAPQILKKDSTSSLQQITPPKRQSKIRGQNISGGFQVAEASDSNFRHFNLPDWAKHPIVVWVQKGSPAFRGGLKEGDLLFQVNGQSTNVVSEVKKAVKKGKNKINVLRYHRRYDKFHLISVSFSL